MKTFEQQVLSYAAYHRDARNKLTHFFGVPLVTFSILVPMAWARIAYGVSGATIFYLAVFLYYLRLDRVIALLQLPFTLTLLALAEMTAALPFMTSLTIFLATFVGGWIIQLIGHYFEGKRPALTDNLLQIFNAPLFLTVEVLFMLGYRAELRRRIDAM
jgi:uncharacterized membrane protein YGL010W